MADPNRPQDIAGSYDEEVKRIERVLDQRQTSGAVSRSDIPAAAPIQFGDSQIQSTPQSGGNAPLRASNPGKKESGSKEQPKEAKAAGSAVASAPNATSGTAAADPGAAKKSKNQLKKENRGEMNAKYWEEVRLGIRPDPRVAKAERAAQMDSDGAGGKKSGGKQQAGKKDSAGSSAAPTDSGASGKSAKSSGAKSSGAASSSATTSASSTGSAAGGKDQGASGMAASTSSISSSSSTQQQGGGQKTIVGAARAMQTSLQYDDPKRKASAKKKQILNRVQTPKELDLFSHMPQLETYTGTVTDAILQGHAHIPAPIVKYGLQLASKQIQGSNARNLAMIDALVAYLETFTPHPSKQFHVDLDLKMKPVIQYVVDSRPLSIGQANIINFLKLKMSELGGDASITTTEDARRVLIRHLKMFKDMHILAADQGIQEKVSNKITDGDVILTFGRSYVVSKSLRLAASQGKKFKVIVLDSNPRFEGVRTLQELADHGIELEYSYLNAISYMLKGVTKVLVGASAMMGNGQLYSRAGTSTVCMMAHSCRVPVLVACETYKFSDKVQLDAITRNELDDPELLNCPNLVGHCALKNWKGQAKLKMLNLVYDLTPSEFIDMIITEHGPVPPTSVPALIREFHTAI